MQSHHSGRSFLGKETAEQRLEEGEGLATHGESRDRVCRGLGEETQLTHLLKSRAVRAAGLKER